MTSNREGCPGRLMLTLRPVAKSDCRLLWEWINDPAVRTSAFESHSIPWPEHVAWFQRKTGAGDCYIYVVMDEERRPVGQVRFEVRGRHAETDVSIAREHRGRGYGAEALRLACSALLREGVADVITAHIRPENVASIRSFEKAGFGQRGRTVIKGVEGLILTLDRRPGPPGNAACDEGRRTKVLLTGAGGSGTIEVIRALKALGRYEVIAVDASRYAAGFVFCDRGYVVPMGAEPAFGPAIRRIIRAERPDAIVPLVDDEILPLHRVVTELPAPRPLLVAPSPPFCVATLDKWETFAMLSQAGIPTPATWLASQAAGVTYPVVVKPRGGAGSRGVELLGSADDQDRYLAQAGKPPDEFVLQRRITGREYTVSSVVGLGGPLLGVVPKEVISKRGITQQAVTRAVPAIDRLCRDIQERVRADGPFNVQLVLDDNGVPYVIEINPRFSTTVALTIAAGVNEVDLVIQHALGEPIGPIVFQPDLLMLRYPTQLYRQVTDWPPDNVATALAEAGDGERATVVDWRQLPA